MYVYGSEKPDGPAGHTLHAQSMYSPHSQELLSIIHHSHQTPPLLSLILYSLYLILYDLNVYYTI